MFGAVIVFAVGRTMTFAQTSGVDDLVGLVGKTVSALDPEGKVFVRGEYWNAQADEVIEEGVAVEVASVDGLYMTVRRTEPS